MSEIQISELEGNRFSVTGTDGKAQTYIPCSKTLWFEVTALKAAYSIREEYDGQQFLTDNGFAGVISGTAELDSSLEVLGISGSKTNAVSFSISAPKAADLAIRAANMGKPGEPVSPVALGYISGDWECGVSAQWYLHIDVSADQLAMLLAAYQTGTIQRLSLGVKVFPLFMNDAYEYSPAAERVDLYLKPNKERPDRDPEEASGTLQSLVYATTEQKLKSTALELNGYQSMEQPTSSESPTLVSLGVRLDQIKASLTFMGWALVAIALILAFK